MDCIDWFCRGSILRKEIFRIIYTLRGSYLCRALRSILVKSEYHVVDKMQTYGGDFPTDTAYEDEEKSIICDNNQRIFAAV